MNESTQLISDLLAELTYMARQTQQSPSLDVLLRARSFLGVEPTPITSHQFSNDDF